MDDKTLKDLASFKLAQSEMIATSTTAWNNVYNYGYSRRESYKDFTDEEIERIVTKGTIEERRRLSRAFYDKSGFYRKIILYYATLLKYAGLVIPNSDKSVNLSKNSIQKKYNSTLTYIDNMKLPSLLTEISTKVLVDGCYYGIILKADKKTFAVMDLPFSFCRTRFKDFYGNDIIEFNVQYFDTIADEKGKELALKVYPKEVSQYYNKWRKNKNLTPWIFLSSDIGICFYLFDCFPLFLNVIPATIQYDEALDNERERELEEIRKIIVQKIPHLTDGGLLFEPEEAVEIHKGTVGMMKNNKNVSVLTTYADVDAIVSKTTSDNVNNTLEKMMQNIYNEAGVSGQLFAATGNLSVEISIKNDTALMMALANKYSVFITSIINRNFANNTINFKFQIMPINYYNESQYITDSFKLAQSGYSFILPAIALGITQRDLVNLKDLENDVLDLHDKLLPLQSAYTQSGEVGRPKTPDDQKSEKTLANERALDAQGGSE